MPTARLRSHARLLAICFLVFVFAVSKTLSAQSPSGTRLSDDEARQRVDVLLKQMTLPAILEIWYPGTQGGNAVANLLFGDAVPGGKLPFAWARDVGQVPINYAHNTTQEPDKQGKRYSGEESTPLFSFGYGLSYSAFQFSNLKLSKSEIRPGETLDVAADLENTGNCAAEEVAQLYIHQRSGSTSGPVRELKGFERVKLGPHQKKTLHFSLGKNELTFWSAVKKDWVDEPSVFDVWVGGDSNAQLHATFVVAP